MMKSYGSDAITDIMTETERLFLDVANLVSGFSSDRNKAKEFAALATEESLTDTALQAWKDWKIKYSGDKFPSSYSRFKEELSTATAKKGSQTKEQGYCNDCIPGLPGYRTAVSASGTSITVGCHCDNCRGSKVPKKARVIDYHSVLYLIVPGQLESQYNLNGLDFIEQEIEKNRHLIHKI
jgi:hypothetical protein